MSIKAWWRRCCDDYLLVYRVAFTIGAAAFGAAVTLGIQAYVHQFIPTDMKVLETYVDKRPDGSHALTIKFSSRGAPECFFISQDLLTRPRSMFRPDFHTSVIPIGLTLQNAEFEVSSETITFTIPADTPLGMWNYTRHSIYVCDIFAGLLFHISEENIAPVVINLE